MKRDIKLLENILTYFEEDQALYLLQNSQTLVNKDLQEADDLVFGHVLLALDAGLISGVSVYKKNDSWKINASEEMRLTMQGHDFLATLRSKTVMAEARKIASQLGLPLSVEILKTAMQRVLGM